MVGGVVGVAGGGSKLRGDAEDTAEGTIVGGGGGTLPGDGGGDLAAEGVIGVGAGRGGRG